MKFGNNHQPATMILAGQSTERLLFQKVSSDHYDQWLKFFQDPQTSLYWKEEKESPHQECEKWYERQFSRYKNNQGGMNSLIEKSSGKLVGHAGLLLQTVDQQQEWEIAYSLLPEFWNKGYAFEAAQKCKELAFAHHLSASLISIISKTNLPSQKVAIKNGMRIDRETIYNRNEVYLYRVWG